MKARNRVDRKEKERVIIIIFSRNTLNTDILVKKQLPITLSNMLRAVLEVECKEHRMEERDQEQVIIHFQENTLNTDIFG